MRDLEKGFHNKQGYLERMAKPLQEKLRITEHISPNASEILDVGCADGVVTKALALLFPHTSVHGIDLSDDFISKAKEEEETIHNPPKFERVYLREMLARPERFDTVLFTSVLHEFYHYGEGVTSILKALADAHELLEPGGKIVIRDMILPERMKESTMPAMGIIQKVRAVPEMEPLLRDFEAAHGPMESLYSVNHFLLKYMYTDNWERECPENYVPVTREEYEELFKCMRTELIHHETYLIPYLREKWRTDFGLTDNELSELFSTTIFAVQKSV